MQLLRGCARRCLEKKSPASAGLFLDVQEIVALSPVVVQPPRDASRGLQLTSDLRHDDAQFLGTDFERFRRFDVEKAVGEADFAQQLPKLFVEAFEQIKRARVHRTLQQVTDDPHAGLAPASSS